MKTYTKSFLVAVSAIFLISILTQVTTSKLHNLKQSTFENTTATVAVREQQLDCLAKNIYHEARSEPFEGKVAVAQVTMNRAANAGFPNDICRVVYQKNVVYEKVICQFSWYCETSTKTRPIHQSAYKESYEVAKKVLLEGFRLAGLTDALYYHATYVSPGWKRQQIAQIGNHIFYK
jgi:spore germination cell wall hydrolase CwlJ-like protein